VYAGYNWQTGPNWLVGIEGDWTFLNGNATDNQAVLETFSTPLPAFNMQTTANNRWLASARGRFGWTPGWTSNRLLLYVTGGVAFTRTNYTATDTGVNGMFGAPIGSTIAFNQDKIGGVVGAGLEWMLTQNWLLRAEYLHYGFDGTTANLPLVSAGRGGCAPGQCSWNVRWGDLGIDTGRIGLSYKFGGPVVAKY
jgi:outer membrane immunogenic protein